MRRRCTTSRGNCASGAFDYSAPGRRAVPRTQYEEGSRAPAPEPAPGGRARFEAGRPDRGDRVPADVAVAEEPRPHGAVQRLLGHLHHAPPRPAVFEEPQLPTRTQHPPYLGQRTREVPHAAQHQRGDGGVEGLALDRQGLRGAGHHVHRHVGAQAAVAANCLSARSGSMATTSDTVRGSARSSDRCPRRSRSPAPTDRRGVRPGAGRRCVRQPRCSGRRTCEQRVVNDVLALPRRHDGPPGGRAIPGFSPGHTGHTPARSRGEG